MGKWETIVHKRFVHYSEAFKSWVIVEEGICCSHGRDWHQFYSYRGGDRYQTEQEALVVFNEVNRQQPVVSMEKVTCSNCNKIYSDFEEETRTEIICPVCRTKKILDNLKEVKIMLEELQDQSQHEEIEMAIQNIECASEWLGQVKY